MLLARFLDMSERTFEERAREVEASDLFPRLLEAGVISLVPYPRARFFPPAFNGLELPRSSEELAELLHDEGDLVPLIQRIGQKAFEECFLRGDGLSDDERALRCGVSRAEAARLRDFMDRIYLRAEFQSSAAPLPARETFSLVAGIEIERGLPVLGFFHGEVWKGYYQVHEGKLAEFLRLMSLREARRATELLRLLELCDRRKTTLYRVLEALLEAQADFLMTGDPDRRLLLLQRALAARLGIAADVLSRLISNKSIRLPWGLEAPIRVLLPKRKSLWRDRLYDLTLAHPELSDEGLRRQMDLLYGAGLSRRSTARYRKELGVGGQGRRDTESPMEARGMHG